MGINQPNVPEELPGQSPIELVRPLLEGTTRQMAAPILAEGLNGQQESDKGPTLKRPDKFEVTIAPRIYGRYRTMK